MFKKNEFCICWIPLIFLGAACGQRNDFRGPQTFGAPQVRAFDDYSQSDSPRQPPPAILTHKQAVTNDGVFNYVFAADNGLKQGESISPDGTRTGAYEYIDPNGKTISVKYKAGKDGFMIIEGDHVPRQPKPVKPIPEFQPPEYRKDYRPSHGQYPDDERTADENDERQDDQRYQQKRVNEGREKFEERQRKNQKYTTQEYQKPKLFRPSEQSQERQQGFLEEFRQAGRGAPRRPAAEPNRAMLYNVEQRHSTNYRKYQDNGQPAGSPESPQSESSAPHFGGGYNFEFKG